MTQKGPHQLSMSRFSTDIGFSIVNVSMSADVKFQETNVVKFEWFIERAD